MVIFGKGDNDIFFQKKTVEKIEEKFFTSGQTTGRGQQKCCSWPAWRPWCGCARRSSATAAAEWQRPASGASRSKTVRALATERLKRVPLDAHLGNRLELCGGRRLGEQRSLAGTVVRQVVEARNGVHMLANVFRKLGGAAERTTRNKLLALDVLEVVQRDVEGSFNFGNLEKTKKKSLEKTTTKD